MLESDLILNVNYRLVSYYHEGNYDKLTADHVLGMIGAVCYPFLEDKIFPASSQAGSIMCIVEYVRKIQKKSKENLSLFSESALGKYLEHIFSSLSIAEKKILLKHVPNITSVEDNGYIRFREMKEIYVSNVLNRGLKDLGGVYGELDWVEELLSEPAFKSRQQRTTLKDNQTYEVRINKFLHYQQLYRKWQDEKKLLVPNYTWQYLLSQADYEELKACVAQGVPTPGKLTEQSALLLSLYIGEYYKREPLPKLGSEVSTNLANAIVKELKKPLYKGRANDAPLNSLYVDGGLPIMYLQKNAGAHNPLVNALECLLNPSDDDDYLIGEENLLDAVSNAAINQSYCAKESVFEFIKYLQEHKTTWDATDDTTFAEFTKLLNQGRDKSLSRNKFKVSFCLWQYGEEFGITPRISLLPGFEGKYNYLVPRDMATKWGVDSDCCSFRIIIRRGKETVQTFTFVNNVNGDYVEHSHQIACTLPTIEKNAFEWDNLKLQKYSFALEQDNGKVIDKTCTFRSLPKILNDSIYNGYLQFYTNDKKGFREWKSFKGATPYLYSAVMFDTDRYEIHGNFTRLNSIMGWVEFADAVELYPRKGGQSIVIYNHRGRIFAKPSASCIHSICRNKLITSGIIDGGVDIYDNSGVFLSKLYLVQAPCSFDTFWGCDDKPISAGADLFVFDGTEYIPYKPTTMLSGYMRFQVRYAGYSTHVDCLVLGQNADICFEHSQPDRLRFKNISNKLISVDNPFVLNTYQNTDCICSDNSKVPANQKSIPFFWNNPIGKAKIELLRPKLGISGAVNGQVVGKELPIIYLEDAQITQVDNAGVRELNLKSNASIYNQMFIKLTSSKTLEPIMISGILKARVYTRDISDGDSHLTGFEWGFLDLNCCSGSVEEYVGNEPLAWARTFGKDGLLFQSLKTQIHLDIHCAPKYIPAKVIDYSPLEKLEERQKRWCTYANNKEYLTDKAFYQFEVACTYRLYFASLDVLLSLVVDNGSKNIDAKKLSSFLINYWKYTQTKESIPNTHGLLRLAQEFGFEWKKISRQITNSSIPELIDYYNNELK